MAEKPIANQTVLAVIPAGEDRTSLINILANFNWKLRFTHAFRETQMALNASPGVVISKVRLFDGYCWTDLFYEMQKMKHPPPLIVADRLADEQLWAEVLNLGGYDLLAIPFDAKEVLHAVNTACRRCENEQRIAARGKPAKPAQHGSVAGTRMPMASGQ